MQHNAPTYPACLLAALLSLVTGCASVPPPSPVLPPPMPVAARTPLAPPGCLPTCLDGWMRLVEQLLPTPTPSQPPSAPAKPPTGP